MEKKEYFILVGKEKKGPYTIEHLKQTGIGNRTKIWHEGLAKWTNASQLPEIQEAISLTPSSFFHRSRAVFFILLVGLLGIAFAAAKLFSKPKAVVLNQHAVLSNQQLYKLYAPSVVLIQHRYIYRITAGKKKFYFNDLYSYDDYSGYLIGLTEDSAAAAGQAELIQGTGFFITNDGKMLTNRHVAKAPPTRMEQVLIRRCFVRSLETALSSINFNDSISKKIEEDDAVLAKLLVDSVANASLIADVEKRISEAEGYLADGEDNEEVETDSATIEYIKNQDVNVEKITLELRIFPEGTNRIEADNGVQCTILATSDENDVDLALLQTASKTLPDTTVKTIDLSRIKDIEQDKGLLPQMSERLILIGYNQGSELAQTTEGIKAQLTDGKVSQNTDAFKLMYTIPTLPGSSGSPVLDDKGRLVSINFAGVTQTQSFNYGVQPSQIKSFLAENGVRINL